MKKSKNNNIILGFMNLVSVDAKERSFVFLLILHTTSLTHISGTVSNPDIPGKLPMSNIPHCLKTKPLEIAFWQ